MRLFGTDSCARSTVTAACIFRLTVGLSGSIRCGAVETCVRRWPIVSSDVSQIRHDFDGSSYPFVDKWDRNKLSVAKRIKMPRS